MKKLFILSMVPFLVSGCTLNYEVMLTDTHGTSTDVIDDNDRMDQEVDPNVSIPSPLKI